MCQTEPSFTVIQFCGINFKLKAETHKQNTPLLHRVPNMFDSDGILIAAYLKACLIYPAGQGVKLSRVQYVQTVADGVLIRCSRKSCLRLFHFGMFIQPDASEGLQWGNIMNVCCLWNYLHDGNMN